MGSKLLGFLFFCLFFLIPIFFFLFPQKRHNRLFKSISGSRINGTGLFYVYEGRSLSDCFVDLCRFIFWREAAKMSVKA